MIIEELLNDESWDTQIQCSTEDEALRMFRFLHEAIKDNKLYVTKVIGFRISETGASNKIKTYIARNINMSDSYTEIMRNLQDKLFFTKESHVDVQLALGENTMTNTKFMKNRVSMSVLASNPYIARTSRKGVKLTLFLTTYNGFSSMEDNSKIVGEKYFPMYTYFSINDYVRILPPIPGDTTVRIRYYNGFRSGHLRSVLYNNNELYKSRDMKEETRKWLSSFDR